MKSCADWIWRGDRWCGINPEDALGYHIVIAIYTDFQIRVSTAYSILKLKVHNEIHDIWH